MADALTALIAQWREKADASIAEASRIRTVAANTDAEDRCLIRAAVWLKCASELAAVHGQAPSLDSWIRDQGSGIKAHESRSPDGDGQRKCGDDGVTTESLSGEQDERGAGGRLRAADFIGSPDSAHCGVKASFDVESAPTAEGSIPGSNPGDSHQVRSKVAAEYMNKAVDQAVEPDRRNPPSTDLVNLPEAVKAWRWRWRKEPSLFRDDDLLTIALAEFDFVVKGEAPEQAPPRLLELARAGAFQLHYWYFDPTENLDEIPPNGHEQPFPTCPHPDCQLVRGGQAPPSPPPACGSMVRTGTGSTTCVRQEGHAGVCSSRSERGVQGPAASPSPSKSEK